MPRELWELSVLQPAGAAAMKPNLYVKHSYTKVDIGRINEPIQTHKLSIKMLDLTQSQVNRIVEFLQAICDEERQP